MNSQDRLPTPILLRLIGLGLLLTGLILGQGAARAAPPSPTGQQVSPAADAPPHATAISGTVVLTAAVPVQPIAIELPRPPLQEPAPAALLEGNLTLTQNAVTPTGPAGPVTNGQVVTYSLSIVNEGSDPVSDLLILDRLPVDTLTDIACSDDCRAVVSAESVIDPFAGTSLITATTAVTWFVASLAPGETVHRQVWGTVGCSPAGAVFTNSLFLDYQQGGQGKTQSNDLGLTARVEPVAGVGLRVSGQPTWCSAGLRGVYDLDWGDFDADGDFDLAVGSVGGTVVYRNQAGRLSRFWQNDRQTFSVRWIDAQAGNGSLELAAAGDGPISPTLGIGSNYLYRPEADRFSEVSAFSSGSPIFRLARADYDGDGLADLAAAKVAPPTNNCLVRLFKNDGQGGMQSGPCALQTAELGGASSPRAEALSWADYDNDGDADLVIGGRKDDNLPFVMVRRNDNGLFSLGHSLSDFPGGNQVETTGLAWGDYNEDGYLDLAVGFMLADERGKAVIYPNNGGGGFDSPFKVLYTVSRSLPLALSWADLNHDGYLDLVVADLQIKYAPGPDYTAFYPLTATESQAQVWAIQLVDYNNDGSIDLSMANRDEPAAVFPAYSPFLAPTLSPVHSEPAAGLAWGDVDGDGGLDLLFGAGDSVFGSQVYYNRDGQFDAANRHTIDGFGPMIPALGDVNGNHTLDLAFATPGQNRIHLAETLAQAGWSSAATEVSRSLAWADAEGDGDLDLLVGNNGSLQLYLNDGAGLSRYPAWQVIDGADARSVSWGDVNRDGYPDFAVANYNQPSRVYCNNRDGTFSPVWQAAGTAATSLAWADYDTDGDLDLLLGHFEKPNQLFSNQLCQQKTCASAPFPLEQVSCGDPTGLDSNPLWESAEAARTTDLAWGDWNQDGKPDLAVGNDDQADQVYVNLTTGPDEARLWLRWQSVETGHTTALAWGDPDGDGDLDLGVSRQGGDASGLYRNTHHHPVHLAGAFAAGVALPHNPLYLSISRPGRTPAAGPHSSAEILSGSSNQTVTLSYQLYDPNGSRAAAPADPAGQWVSGLQYAYSLDGGATWQTATPASVPPPALTGSRQGRAGVFFWDAQADQAVSDDARFRISLVDYLGQTDQLASPPYTAGQPRYAGVQAVSPPFRVRGLSCVWPKGPRIKLEPAFPQPRTEVRFEAVIQEGSGQIDYRWNFGDGSPITYGPLVYHTFPFSDRYTVTLTVRGPACPTAGEAVATQVVGVGVGRPGMYLPLIAH